MRMVLPAIDSDFPFQIASCVQVFSNFFKIYVQISFELLVTRTYYNELIIIATDI